MSKSYPRFLIGILLATLILSSCTSQEERELRASLKQAGDNRPELEAVLTHYAEDADSRKLEAARFLIRNMQYHSTATSPEIERYYLLMDSISRLTPTRWKISAEQDSLFDALDNPFEKPQTKFYDNQIVKADELIRHIDDAFALYDSATWCRGIDFGTFCEYLLPYRVADESPDLDWMPFYQEKVRERAYKAFPYCMTIQDTLYTILNRMSTNYKINIEYKQRYPYGYKPQQLYSLKRGTCQDYNILSCYMFRSVGIPMALDFVPLWGNRSLGHDCAALFISKAIIDTTSVLDYSFSAAPKPLGQYLSSNPNIPTKVYRTTFSRQQESLAAVHGEEEIPPVFESAFIKDVSPEYRLTHEVTIELEKADRNHRFYYLCSYDNKEWLPVAWVQRKGDKVTFQNVGGDIVYLPCKYEKRRMKPVSSPVIIHKDGKIEPLVTDTRHLQSLTLYRKYTEGENIRRYSRLFQGGRIEASNDAAFQNPIVLYRFPDSVGVNYQHLRLRLPFECRYVRFVSGEDKNGGEVADFQIYDSEGKTLRGKPIGSDGWDGRNPLISAFDDDILSFAKSTKGKDAWLGLDLGKRCSVSKILILPHNDDNFIRVGEVYQLQYWDRTHWRTIEEQLGDERQCIKVDFCPTGALFRLRNLSRGKEERIFTYEKGRQVWW